MDQQAWLPKEGHDEDLVKLGALGSSRVKRLLSRQQDRMSQKETVEAAKEAAREAAEAAQTAQAVVWQQHGYQWGQASQAYQWPQQAYQWQWRYYPAYCDPSQGQSFFFAKSHDSHVFCCVLIAEKKPCFKIHIHLSFLPGGAATVETQVPHNQPRSLRLQVQPMEVEEDCQY